MIPFFRLGIGGPLGSGRQWVSWVHVDDLCALFQFLLENGRATGAFNGTAPNPVTMRELARALGRVLHLLRELRQMLRNHEPRRRSGDGLELAADFDRRLRLQVEHVHVRWTAEHVEQDDRLCATGGTGVGGGLRAQQVRQRDAGEERRRPQTRVEVAMPRSSAAAITSRTVRCTLSGFPYPVSMSATTGTVTASTMCRTRSIVSDIVSSPKSGCPNAEALNPNPVVNIAENPARSASRADNAS